MLTRTFRLWHVFSLDVVLAAMAMSVWVFLAHQAPLNWPLIVSLGLFVWAVYLLDHALDATRLSILGPRRQPHFNNRKVFWSLATLALLGSFTLCAPYWPFRNSAAPFFVFAALVLLCCYLGLSLFPAFKKVGRYKEILLPPGYTVGVALPFILSQNNPKPDFFFLIGMNLLVYQSILVLAKIDAQDDALEKNSTNIQLKSYQYLSALFGVCAALWLGMALVADQNKASNLWVGLGLWAFLNLVYAIPNKITGWKLRTAIEWSLCLPGLCGSILNMCSL